MPNRIQTVTPTPSRRKPKPVIPFPPGQRVLVERDTLDHAIDTSHAARLVGKLAYHPACIGGFGLIVKAPSGKYMIKGRVKCHVKGCRHVRTVWFGSGLHNGAFCYAKDPKTNAYIANFRDQVYNCGAHK